MIERGLHSFRDLRTNAIKLASAFWAILIVALIISTTSMLAQNYEIRNQRVVPPEAAHFVEMTEPGVDAQGDLHLSIPLMTVPGRNGLDFEIVAQYRSSIKLTQPASWIGLGWSLDVGSLTRHPMGGLDYQKQVDWDRFIFSNTINQQPDVYVAHFNNQTTQLIPYTHGVTPSHLPFAPAMGNEDEICIGNQGGMEYNFVPYHQ